MTAAAEMPNPNWRPDGWDVQHTAQPTSGWLTDGDIAVVRAQLPLVYVNAVPIRVDSAGDVLEVGVLLKMAAQGLTRAIVAGRVLYHERVRDALVRHIETDLGPHALPAIPATPQPFTVAEYFPTPGITPFFDPRQHAIALCYIVPVAGDCHPRQDAVQIDWLSPEAALSQRVQEEFSDGQGALVKQAIAHLGRLV
jgi:ADP-ribose pyrophosphatase YjhB (NUDIX family)